MRRPLSALVAASTLLAGASAHAADYVPGEVVVRTENHGTKVHRIGDGSTVTDKAAELAGKPYVKSATPNFIARASFLPDDPGRRPDVPSGWTRLQWNFLDTVGGVNAIDAWDNLIAAGAPGGRGVTVAVVDTGVAYRSSGRFVRSPDLTRRIAKGYDFVDNDKLPLDHNGHGTHVASTITETVDNGVGLTGLAYGATLMPIRVLNRRGRGDAVAIANGIRYAARRGAEIINLSFEFPGYVKARGIPGILSALDYARSQGSLVVAASGNAGVRAVAYPARAMDVLSVGAITEHGCQAEYSNRGPGLDITAPGGGQDAIIASDPNCKPEDAPGRDVFQLTLAGSVGRFGIPGGYEGTSMAAPHVSAVAAMIIASGVIGKSPQARRHRAAPRDDRHRPRTGRPGSPLRRGQGRCSCRHGARRDTHTDAEPDSHRDVDEHADAGPDDRSLGRTDDQDAAGRVVRDLVRHGAEQEALRARHALVADHDQVGALLLGDVEDRVGRVALARVRVDVLDARIR